MSMIVTDQENIGIIRGKSLIELQGTTFLPDWLTTTHNLCLIYFKITWALAILLELVEHMHKNFEINRIKIKGSCQSGRKVVTHDSKSDLPLANISLTILK